MYWLCYIISETEFYSKFCLNISNKTASKIWLVDSWATVNFRGSFRHGTFSKVLLLKGGSLLYFLIRYAIKAMYLL